jgi:hypothetical protein
MNLENLNLVELDAQEVSQIDGGCWECAPLGHHLRDFVDGFLSAFGYQLI